MLFLPCLCHLLTKYVTIGFPFTLMNILPRLRSRILVAAWHLAMNTFPTPSFASLPGPTLCSRPSDTRKTCSLSVGSNLQRLPERAPLRRAGGEYRTAAGPAGRQQGEGPPRETRGSPAPVSAPAGQVALRPPSRISHRATTPQGESEGPRRPQPWGAGRPRPRGQPHNSMVRAHRPVDPRDLRQPIQARAPDHRDDGGPGLDQPRSAARRRRPVPLQRSQLGAAAIFLEERARGEGSPQPGRSAFLPPPALPRPPLLLSSHLAPSKETSSPHSSYPQCEESHYLFHSYQRKENKLIKQELWRNRHKPPSW